jgi:hypothetical protein
MPLYAVLSAEGLCEGVLTMDLPSAAAHPLQPGETLRQVTPAEATTLQQLGHHAMAHGKGWAVVPESHARKLERGRGIPASHAYAYTQRRRDVTTALAETGQLAAFALLEDGDPALPAPIPTPWPGLVRPFDAIQIRDGLTVRHMTEAECDPLSEIMLSSGAYDGLNLQECWNMAHDWWRDPTIWALALDWRAQVLQYEIFHFDGKRDTARGGFVTHVSRERPAWFWRECSKPVFLALQSYGFRKMLGHVRPDRKDWADSLAETYGAQNMGLMNGFWTVQYDLATMVAQATGWRVPETAGEAWVGIDWPVGVTEVSSDQLDASVGHVAAAWGARPRGAYAQAMVRERVELDAGTLLWGRVNGALRTIWVMRWKAPGVINWAVATPWDQSPENGHLYRLAVRWCVAAGFPVAQSIWPKHLWDHAAQATQKLRMEWTEVGRITTDAGTFIDATSDLTRLLTRPDAAWEAIA